MIDLFEYVSSPHYFCEIGIYLSLLSVVGITNISMCMIVLFVICNLSLTATQTHSWYRNKFNDMPKNRKIVIPFLY